VSRIAASASLNRSHEAFGIVTRLEPVEERLAVEFFERRYDLWPVSGLKIPYKFQKLSVNTFWAAL